MKKTIPALTFDIEKDGWEASRGFIMRQIPMPALDEANNPKDRVSVILKIKYAGVCGSDRGIWNRNAFKDAIHNSLKKKGVTTRILGHEFVGEIVQMGSMVKTLYADSFSKEKLEVGSLVSGDSHITCGKCYQCRIGENNVCINEAILGISIDGIFATYVKIPAKNLWPVDVAAVRPEIAAMLDPFGNAVHAISKFDARGKDVAVLGAGPIGLFSILLLKNSGASKIIVADGNKENLDLARELGATDIAQVKERETITPAILALTDGRGVDATMEMAGPNSSVNTSIEITRRGGQVILFGLKDGDFTIPKFSTIITKGLTLHGVIGRRIFETWQTAQRMLAKKSNGIQDNIWNVILKKGEGTIIPFSQYQKEAVQKAMELSPKIIFNMET